MLTAALKLRGLVAPVFTPMRPDGSFDLDRVEKQAERLTRDGVVGVFVGGTTGEGLSLTIPERQQLTERWCAIAAGRFPVIAHVGNTCLADAKELAAHARKCGAAAIAAVPPFYYSPRSVDDVVSCCAEVAAAAPTVPFYYYHIPGNTGVNVDVAELMESASARIPTLAGLKFSDGDLVGFARVVDWSAGGYDVFFGVDELLLPALSLGATAAIGSTYNFAAPLYRRMIDAFGAADMAAARRINKKVRELAALMQHLGGIPAMKAAMRLAGVDCGPCRLPLRDLGEQELESLRRGLKDVQDSHTTWMI